MWLFFLCWLIFRKFLSSWCPIKSPNYVVCQFFFFLSVHEPTANGFVDLFQFVLGFLSQGHLLFFSLAVAQLRLAIVEAVGYMTHCFSPERLTSEIGKIIAGFLGLYKRHTDYYFITQVRQWPSFLSDLLLFFPHASCCHLLLCDICCWSAFVAPHTSFWSLLDNVSHTILPGQCLTCKLWMGLVRIMSWYPEVNGSHCGLPPSSIHRMTGLGGKMVWTLTYSHRPHSFFDFAPALCRSVCPPLLLHVLLYPVFLTVEALKWCRWFVDVHCRACVKFCKRQWRITIAFWSRTLKSSWTVYTHWSVECVCVCVCVCVCACVHVFCAKNDQMIHCLQDSHVHLGLKYCWSRECLQSLLFWQWHIFTSLLWVGWALIPGCAFFEASFFAQSCVMDVLGLFFSQVCQPVSMSNASSIKAHNELLRCFAFMGTCTCPANLLSLRLSVFLVLWRACMFPLRMSVAVAAITAGLVENEKSLVLCLILRDLKDIYLFSLPLPLSLSSPCVFWPDRQLPLPEARHRQHTEPNRNVGGAASLSQFLRWVAPLCLGLRSRLWHHPWYHTGWNFAIGVNFCCLHAHFWPRAIPSMAPDAFRNMQSVKSDRHKEPLLFCYLKFHANAIIGELFCRERTTPLV